MSSHNSSFRSASSTPNGGNDHSIVPPNGCNRETFNSYFKAQFASFQEEFRSANQETSNNGHDYGAVEQLRGATFSPPVLGPQDLGEFDEDPYHHVGPESPSSSEESESEVGSVVDELPIEVRRKIPGCGVNHFGRGDNSVRAETSPVQPSKYFGEGRVRSYARPPAPSQRRLMPLSFRYGINPALHNQSQRLPLSAIVDSSQSQRQELQRLRERRIIRDPRYPYFNGELSPCSSLSSSSSSSSSCSSPSWPELPPDGGFHPIFQSSFLETPPHQIMDVNPRNPRANQHPAYIPSFVVHSSEGYSSPESASLPSFMEMTPPVPGRTYTVPPQGRNQRFEANTIAGPSSSAEAFGSSRNSTARRRLNFD